jgi:hypothetical protein
MTVAIHAHKSKYINSYFFRARFRPQFSEKDAAKAIIEVVESSCLNIRYVMSASIIGRA